MFPSFPHGKHCFQCQLLFPRCKLCARCTARNFNENPSMRARASGHSPNFCAQFEKRPIFASTFKFNGTIRYPLHGEAKSYCLGSGSYVAFLPCRIQFNEFNSNESNLTETRRLNRLPHFCRTFDWSSPIIRQKCDTDSNITSNFSAMSNLIHTLS